MLTRRAALLSPATICLLCGEQQDGQPVTNKKLFSNAEAYERFMGRWSRPLASAFVTFAEPHLPAQARLLDVGSGTGALAAELAQRYPNAQILGIDPAPEYVAYAAQQNARTSRIRFETGDAQQLTLAPHTFDAALALLVFNFI